MDLFLKAEKREVIGKKVQQLRKCGKIPAIIYGSEIEPTILTVDYQEFEKVYKKAGESTLVNLKIAEAKDGLPILIHSVAHNPVSGKVDHIDFYKIKYGQKLTATVELKFIGESKAVKELGGILSTVLKSVEIECLPRHLISKIEVDLSALKNFNDIIHIKDLHVPENIKIITDNELVVANVSQPKVEEEVKKEEAEQPKEEKEGEEKDGDKKEGGKDQKDGKDAKQEKK
ncbi:50S ribosomal protein L25 [Candidatus Parcubacteria bacterium]|nr:50S ribosomal protein L25 [Candidatus Parcubacteria bacterium]